MYVSLSLDKNDKHTTSFTFSKMDYINVKINIDKNKNVSTCIAELCTYIDDDKNKMIESNEMAYVYLLMIQKYLITWLCSIL